MRFDRESYRKLYVAESPEHQLLPLVVRGLRDYLIRFAGEDGTLLASTVDPVGDLSVVLRARPKERKYVELILTDLQRVGYLRIDDGRLWLPRYEEAQAARSPGAVRQQRYRDNHSNKQSDVTRNADSDVTNNVTSNRRDLAEIQEPPSGVARARARRAPADFEPKPEHVNLGISLGIVGETLASEVAKFRDHEFAAPRSDWDAAFRNWLRKSLEVRRAAIGKRDESDRERRLAGAIPSEQVPYYRTLR